MNDELDTMSTPGTPGSSRRRTWVRAGTAAAIVAAGGLGGFALGRPGTSSAQTDTTVPSDGADAPDGLRPFRGGRFGGPLGGLDAAADALGMTTDELHDALHDGQTLAEIAAAEGVAVDDLVAAMVADATERLDAAVEAGELDEARAEEIEADLTERITAMVNGELPAGGFRGPGGPGFHGGFVHGPNLDTAAEVLGLEVDALAERLRAGETLAEIADAEGVDVDELIDALVDDARARITDMVNGVRPEAPGSTDGGDESGSGTTGAGSSTSV
jgi:hypothetical protein